MYSEKRLKTDPEKLISVLFFRYFYFSSVLSMIQKAYKSRLYTGANKDMQIVDYYSSLSSLRNNIL